MGEYFKIMSDEEGLGFFIVLERVLFIFALDVLEDDELVKVLNIGQFDVALLVVAVSRTIRRRRN